MNLTFRKLIAGSLLFSSLSFVAEENQKDFIELSYGEHEKQKIDFYPGGSKKVLVWIHGGGWVFGGKRASRWIERLERYYEVNNELNIFSIGATPNTPSVCIQKCQLALLIDAPFQRIASGT